MSALVLRHDPQGAMSYGFFRCQECDVSMFDGGPFAHRKSCSRSGYEGLEYHMGDKAIAAVLRDVGSLNPIGAEELRRQLPEDVARVEAEGGAR